MKKLILTLLLITSICFAEFDARKEIIKFMEGNPGLEKYLTAPVTVMHTDTGCLSIKDEGIFAFQHELLSAEVSADPNVAVDENVKIPAKADKLVVVVHGWMDKGQNSWPSEMAAAIAHRVDPNEWVCGSYDWKGGSVVFISVQAAEYARDIAGPRLAKAILALGTDFKHVHLIGHSAGSWAINGTAKTIAAARSETQFHLTFLDAYVPERWDPDVLGRIFDDAKKQKSQVWAEQYYTKDITWKLTEHDLKYAHNVDISAIDPLFSEHEFPYRWYAATATGTYSRWDEKKEPIYTHSGEIDYGFARSLESGEKNWKKSRKLKLNNPAIRIKKKDK
ncbi:MAG: hypothetical protein OEV87_02420 [Phycisphaerae bacterium]|nr:hypothetical protein [Phycisphaerae bacterium]